jgi:hypothetical protein
VDWLFFRVVYHYTDLNCLDKILECGHIEPSEKKRGDAFHGPGVYVSPLPPNTSTTGDVIVIS